MRRVCVTQFVPQPHEHGPGDRSWASTSFIMAMLIAALAAAVWACGAMLGLSLDA
ncbi:hypothetical protein SAMN05444161_5420 [Rhizobiales bacterium GAS191]|nr:hypothetical protein SAMN05519103_04657 [Rhizobiales bacterium GAS113]SEE25604.1 hypothetical protein SAMN05519104_5602 [Rhizobiales bacterium GAS188]SEE32030.1 hypothetical protein SAMN05444161_5420 [Rhizobiales bacterium GAS191]